MSREHDKSHLETASLYALQILSASEIPAFEAHLSTCAECSREIQILRPIIDSFVSWPTDVLRPSTSLWNSLLQRISSKSGAPPIAVPAQTPSKTDWEQVAPGISCKILAVDTQTSRVSMLVRLAPGTNYPPHRHADIEELHLLHGELLVDEKKLRAGDFIKAKLGSTDHRVWSQTGCTCFLLTSTNDELL